MAAESLEGFPRRLKLLMDAEGLSTRDLAARTGGEVSHSAIAQWLNGTNRATTEQVRYVADALGWDVYELLHARPAADIIDRLTELDAALRRVRRALSAATAATDLRPAVQEDEPDEILTDPPTPSRKPGKRKQ